MKLPPEIRYWRGVKFMPSGCWHWGDCTDPSRYPRMMADGRFRKIARWVYERTFGELPSRAIVVRHICDNPNCVRVAHLIHGTMKDNNRDRDERGRTRKGPQVTHCVHGHEYTPESTHREKSGKRCCKTCRYAKQNERGARKRALRTHCRRGHVLSVANPMNSNGCRTCRQEISNERWRKERQSA